ncbi:hypothetical protein OAO87_00180 [bacterium]|nr:hypothetical protein [bacterium]
MSLRPGSERLKHRLLEPTYSASSPGATAAACGTLEYPAAPRNAICGVRAPPQTSALGCPWAAYERTGRCRGTPPSKTTVSPAILRPRRRYFGAPLPSTRRVEDAAQAARWRAEATTTGTSTAQTFTNLGATSRTIDASVAAQPHLRRVRGLIVYLLAFNSSSIGASARLLRRLRALSRRSGAACLRPASQPAAAAAATATAAAAAAAATVRRALEPPTEPARRRMSALSSLPSGDSFVPCWCWQARATPPSYTA